MTVKQKPMIQAVDVWKSFGNLDVLKGIDMEVYPGEVACLIGPSGSGKSTLLRCVNHLEKVNAGRLYVDGELIGYHEREGVLHEMSEKDAAKQRRDIGMVFQSFNLFPHLKAIDNVTLGPRKVRGVPKAEAAASHSLRVPKVKIPVKHRREPEKSRSGAGSQRGRVVDFKVSPSSKSLAVRACMVEKRSARSSSSMMPSIRAASRRPTSCATRGFARAPSFAASQR